MIQWKSRMGSTSKYSSSFDLWPVDDGLLLPLLVSNGRFWYLMVDDGPW